MNLSINASEVGKCEFFDVNPYLQVSNQLVAADEPLRALEVLKLVPGYYRDNPPPELEAQRLAILALLATPTFYANNVHDFRVQEEGAGDLVQGLLRGQLILKDVQDYNAKGLMPHLIDLGPGEYWLPIGLKKLGCKFTYLGVGLCEEAKRKAHEILKDNLWSGVTDRPKIFVACEIIEHLHHEEDIAVEFGRLNANADIIHISTPKYTWDGRNVRLDWNKPDRDLGHLRTYTPGEFQNVVMRMFPRSYKWAYYDSTVQHMRGWKD